MSGGRGRDSRLMSRRQVAEVGVCQVAFGGGRMRVSCEGERGRRQELGLERACNQTVEEAFEEEPGS